MPENEEIIEGAEAVEPEPEEVEEAEVEETEDSETPEPAEDEAEAEPVAAVSDDQAILDRAAALGWSPPTASVEAAATPDDDEELPDFMSQALEEAAKLDKPYTWAQSRAGVLGAQWAAERQAWTTFNADDSTNVAGFRSEFLALGIPEEAAETVAKDYHGILKTMGPEVLRRTPEAKGLCWLAMQAAKGMQFDRNLQATKASDGDVGAPRREAPGGGARGGVDAIVGQINSDGRAFIEMYTREHGSKPTAEMLKTWKAEGTI